MRIRYLDGLTASRKVENEQAAKDVLIKQFPTAFFGEWEEMDTIRLPVWADEDSSIDDDGDGAIAYIEEVA